MSAIAGEELAGAYERHGSGHTARVYLRDCGHDAAPTLDARRDRHRVRIGVPRRHHRQRRVAQHRARAAVTHLRRPRSQTYVVSGYLAILAALLIVAGALSDHYGRRRVCAIGLASFAVASVLCGLAPTLEWLVAFRLLQGAAGALLVPGALSIDHQTFEAGPSAAVPSASGRPPRPVSCCSGRCSAG